MVHLELGLAAALLAGEAFAEQARYLPARLAISACVWMNSSLTGPRVVFFFIVRMPVTNRCPFGQKNLKALAASG